MWTPYFNRNKHFYFTGAIYVAALFVLAIAARGHLSWVSISRDTAKMMLSTVMGVSGSIIGFLVIYLSLALEGLKRNYGRHAVGMFRKDGSIWILCGFFCWILVLAIFSFIWADTSGYFWTWSFNAICLSFLVGIAAIVPFGVAILNRTETTVKIYELIDQIRPDDFRPLPDDPSAMGPIYWTLTEKPDNRVDKLSAILYHNITENNSRLAADILLKFFDRISIWTEVSKGIGIERMVYRYFDVLLTAFDYAKIGNNEVVIKTMLGCLTSASKLVAKWKMEADAVARLFAVIQSMTQYFIEQNKEQLTYESLWAYYHMAKAQVSGNLPPAGETWDIQDNGKPAVLDNQRAAANEHQFDALDKVLTYDLSQLVDRSFYSENRYIWLNAVSMTGNFLGMLVHERGIELIPKSLLGTSLAFQASKYIIKVISPLEPNNLGYLRLYLGNSELMAALGENPSFSIPIFDSYIEICRSVIEQDALIKWDLIKIGGLGRSIVANAATLTDPARRIRSLLEINRLAREAIARELECDPDRHRRFELNEMKVKANEDVRPWLSTYQRKSIDNAELEDVIRLYIENMDLNPD